MLPNKFQSKFAFFSNYPGWNSRWMKMSKFDLKVCDRTGIIPKYWFVLKLSFRENLIRRNGIYSIQIWSVWIVYSSQKLDIYFDIKIIFIFHILGFLVPIYKKKHLKQAECLRDAKISWQPRKHFNQWEKKKHCGNH